jgi:3D (Asp-Asp-Asp) domain-containing protein
MRSRSKNTGYIFLVNRKFILGVILLLVILYGLAGTAGFESAEAGTGSQEAMLIATELSSQMVGDQVEIEVKNEVSEQVALWQTIRMRVTAYCWCWRCCGKHSDGITANGHRIRLRDTFVAADKMHSFGTEMIIPGYNNSQPVKVLDRGGAIRGNQLDVFFNSHQKALEWGVQYLPVKVCTR